MALKFFHLCVFMALEIVLDEVLLSSRTLCHSATKACSIIQLPEASHIKVMESQEEKMKIRNFYSLYVQVI